MKKILIIGLSPILGGVETYIYNLIRFFNKKEYYFDFLIVGNEKSVFEDEINILLNDGINHFHYCPNLKKEYIKGQKWLKKFYKNNKYDIIYLNTCTCARIQYCFGGIMDGAKLISHSHNGNGDSKINNFVFRPILKSMSKVKLSCSDLASKWLFGTSKNVQIVSNGVDTSRFCYNQKNRDLIRKNLNVKKDDILIGHVGRFSKQKNHKYFINLAHITKKNYKFLLIGDGELKDEFIALVNENELKNRFYILPSKDDIEKYYSAMDLFVMPSLYEGLPIVSVEAQTNGLSCIFSDTVSRNANLSGNCSYVSLTEKQKWKKEIEKNAGLRFDGVKEIKNKKFDIESTVKMLEDSFDKVTK